MADNPSISLVFPAYNEASNLPTLISAAFINASKITTDFEVIIVNDGSQDNTIEILDELRGKFGERLVVFNFKPNKGYAFALRTGFLKAKKDLIFYSDSDNQFDLSEIPLLLKYYKENDIVIGYRKDRQDNFLRLFVSKGYNTLIRLIFGLKVRDIDCAFKLFKRDVFKKIDIKLEKFLIDTEVLVKAKKLGMKIAQVGVSHLPRLKGSSTVRARDVLFTLRGLVKLRKDLKGLNR